MGRKPSLNSDQVAAARQALTSGTSLEDLSSRYGVSTSTIRRVTAAPKADTFSHKVSAPYSELGSSGLERFGSFRDDYLRDWQTLDKLVDTVKRMMDHPVISAITLAVEMTVRSAKWTVEPASEDQPDVEAAEFLDSCLNDMSHTIDDHLSQAITMCWYGFSPFETVYKRRLGPDRDPESNYDDGLVGWRKFAYRSPDTLAFGDAWDIDDKGGIQALNQLAPPTYQPAKIPIDKLLLYRTTVHKNNPQGRSLLRGAYMAWYYSKNLAEVEGISAERMGSGIPVVYLGTDTTKGSGDTDFAKAQKLVRNVRVDEQYGIVFPYPKMGGGAAEGKGVLFELVSPPSRGIINFHETIERYNKQMAQTLLAQFIYFGLSEQGTQALAVRVTDFFTMAAGGWLGIIADTINRYAVPRLFHLNGGKFGGITGFPVLTFSPLGQIDVGKLMTGINQAVQAHALHPDEGVERRVRELLELPEIDPKVLEEKERQQQEAEARAKAEAEAKRQETIAPAEGEVTPGGEKPDMEPAEAKAPESASVRRVRESFSIKQQYDNLMRGLKRRIRRG